MSKPSMKPAFKPKHSPLTDSLLSDPYRDKQQRKLKAAEMRNKANLSKKSSRLEFEDSKMSQKILQIARQQHSDIIREEENNSSSSGNNTTSSSTSSYTPLEILTGEFGENLDSTDSTEVDLEDQAFLSSEDPNQYLAELKHLSREEEEIMELFKLENSKKLATLGTFVQDRIEANQIARDLNKFTITDDILKDYLNIDPKIINVYKTLGGFLKNYRSGKFPKAFHVIPLLKNWEDILYLTNPAKWSPHALYRATRQFSSNMTDKQAQRYYNLVLLPKLREEIHETSKLSFHSYMALKKAAYKPKAFYNGIILALCQEGTASLRETFIIGSVIRKVKIDPTSSAAAMYMITSKLPWSGTSLVFLNYLIQKRYSLPISALSSIVAFFAKISREKRKLPVLWHTTLLKFVQSYHQHFDKTQRDALKFVLRRQTHDKITSQIRKILFN